MHYEKNVYRKRPTKPYNRTVQETGFPIFFLFSQQECRSFSKSTTLDAL